MEIPPAKAMPGASGQALRLILCPLQSPLPPARRRRSSLCLKCLQQSCRRRSFLLPPHPTYLSLTPLKDASTLAFPVHAPLPLSGRGLGELPHEVWPGARGRLCGSLQVVPILLLGGGSLPSLHPVSPEDLLKHTLLGPSQKPPNHVTH